MCYCHHETLGIHNWSHVGWTAAANAKELVKYLRGEIRLSEGSAETAEALLVYEMPPFASLSPLQGQLPLFYLLFSRVTVTPVLQTHLFLRLTSTHFLIPGT